MRRPHAAAFSVHVIKRRLVAAGLSLKIAEVGLGCMGLIRSDSRVPLGAGTILILYLTYYVHTYMRYRLINPAR